MKTTAKVATAIVMAVMTGAGAAAKSPAGRQVTVYNIAHDAVPHQVEAGAQQEASEIFAQIGVNLLWLFGNPSRPGAGSIAIEIVNGMPATFMPGSLAYAFPYEGVHIRIFWDRISGYATPREVLAHVMVHEITHILQGEARHSDEGIMKAHWGPGDLAAMAKKPLSFTSLDVDLIHKGIIDREALTASNSGVSGARKTTTAAVGVVGKQTPSSSPL